MFFLANAEENFISILEKLGGAWWIELVTNNPWCTYYFGPFGSYQNAQLNLDGYIEDLEQEATQIIAVSIQRHQPKQLTIFDD